MSLWTDPQIVNHRIDEPGAISFYTSQGNLLKRNYTKIERREISQKKNRKRKPEKCRKKVIALFLCIDRKKESNYKIDGKHKSSREETTAIATYLLRYIKMAIPR